MPARFSLLNASFDDFLFASIGEEASGMPLSVASVLARHGTDPWIEAGRLARLPQAKATEALAAMIADVPLPSWQPAELPGIVARLIGLLPGVAAAASPRAAAKHAKSGASGVGARRTAPPTGDRAGMARRPGCFRCLVTAATFAALSNGMTAEDRSVRPSPCIRAERRRLATGDCPRQFQFNKETGHGQGSKTQ